MIVTAALALDQRSKCQHLAYNSFALLFLNPLALKFNEMVALRIWSHTLAFFIKSSSLQYQENPHWLQRLVY